MPKWSSEADVAPLLESSLLLQSCAPSALPQSDSALKNLSPRRRHRCCRTRIRAESLSVAPPEVSVAHFLLFVTPALAPAFIAVPRLLEVKQQKTSKRNVYQLVKRNVAPSDRSSGSTPRESEPAKKLQTEIPRQGAKKGMMRPLQSSCWSVEKEIESHSTL